MRSLIALGQVDLVVAAGHAGQCRHGLALRTGANEHGLVGGHALKFLGIDQHAARDLQIAQFTGGAHVADHGAAHKGDLAVVLVRRVNDLLDAVHVAGEAGNHYAARGRAHDLVDGRDQVGFCSQEAGNFGVGGVGHEQVNALLAQAGEAGKVGDALVQRELVHLEVASFQHQAGRRADGNSQTVRDGVVHCKEFDVERAKLAAVAFLDRDQLALDPVLVQLGLQEGQGQLGGDDGDVAAVLEQVRDTANVVLVTVGQHQANHVRPAVLQVGEVGDDDVDAGVVLLGEQNAAVNDQQLAAKFEDCHVAANLPQSTEGDDAHCSFGKGGRGLANSSSHGIPDFIGVVGVRPATKRGLLVRFFRPNA